MTQDSSHEVLDLPVPVAFANDTLLLHTLLSTLDEGVIVFDREGHVALINQAAERMMQPLVSVDIFPVMEALQGKIIDGLETAYRPGQGLEEVRLLISARPLLGPNHTPEGCIVVVRNVTRFKQMEKDLLDVTGDEKKRLGQDLHDGVCQILTGIKYMCNVLVGKLSSRSAPESADVSEIQLLVSQALMEADTIAKGMFPVRLEAEGLTSALEELASHTSRLYRVSCRFLCEKEIVIHNADVALNVYRIAQEALTNGIKHGKAKNIVLWLTAAEERFTLIIKNDSLSIPQPSSRRGMGRRIMSSRADKIGATLLFEHVADGGTLITCEFCDTHENKGA